MSIPIPIPEPMLKELLEWETGTLNRCLIETALYWKEKADESNRNEADERETA